MVSTPFGLKFSIVFLLWISGCDHQTTYKKRHKPFRPTARQEHLLSYTVSSISRNTVRFSAFWKPGLEIFLILSFFLVFAIIRLFKNTGSSMRNDVFYKASGISACGKSAGCLETAIDISILSVSDKTAISSTDIQSNLSKRRPLQDGHLELVLAFRYSFYLTLYKTDISLRRTLTTGPRGVRLSKS